MQPAIAPDGDRLRAPLLRHRGKAAADLFGDGLGQLLADHAADVIFAKKSHATSIVPCESQ